MRKYTQREVVGLAIASYAIGRELQVRRQLGYLSLAGFIGSIVLANWMIGNVGVQFGGAGPHLLPVGFGLFAPSGVLAAGLSFSARDAVREHLGARWMFIGVLVGALLSALMSPALALASGGAFLLSELLDAAVYEPLRKRSPLGALVASNTAGAVADSVLFQLLAFGSLELLAGQVVGKLWMTAAVALVIFVESRLRQQ